MMSLSDGLPPLMAGIVFTGLGIAKVYGLTRGIQGGGEKPARVRACGSCPSWNRGANLAFVLLLLAAGIGNLALFGWILTAKAGHA